MLKVFSSSFRFILQFCKWFSKQLSKINITFNVIMIQSHKQELSDAHLLVCCSRKKMKSQKTCFGVRRLSAIRFADKNTRKERKTTDKLATNLALCQKIGDMSWSIVRRSLREIQHTEWYSASFYAIMDRKGQKLDIRQLVYKLPLKNTRTIVGTRKIIKENYHKTFYPVKTKKPVRLSLDSKKKVPTSSYTFFYYPQWFCNEHWN